MHKQTELYHTPNLQMTGPWFGQETLSPSGFASSCSILRAITRTFSETLTMNGDLKRCVDAFVGSWGIAEMTCVKPVTA